MPFFPLFLFCSVANDLPTLFNFLACLVGKRKTKNDCKEAFAINQFQI